jgi:hypothetical protein
MGKNKDIEIASNILAQAIIHKIVPDYTNKPESIEHMKKEQIEYKTQSFKTLAERNWNEDGKKKIRENVIEKVQNILRLKYPDIIIDKEELLERINIELTEYLL